MTHCDAGDITIEEIESNRLSDSTWKNYINIQNSFVYHLLEQNSGLVHEELKSIYTQSKIQGHTKAKVCKQFKSWRAANTEECPINLGQLSPESVAKYLANIKNNKGAAIKPSTMDTKRSSLIAPFDQYNHPIRMYKLIVVWSKF